MEQALIEKMLLIRRVEEEIIARYGKQQIRCPVHLSIGQEAIAVGACQNLSTADSVFSTHRSHAHYLAKGGDLNRMILELHGKVGGCQDGRGGSMHLNDKSVNVMSIPIVASAIPLAVGAALANKMDGNGNIVVCFFGDAAVEEGVFHESLNFASLMQLPIIFVCENNEYSVDTHIEKRQPYRSLMDLAKAHKIISISCNDSSVFSFADRVRDEIAFIRAHNRPVFIQANTQRSHVHCGVAKEFELQSDPLAIAIKESGIRDIHLNSIEAKIKEKIIKAFNDAEVAPLPTLETARDYVYA